MIAPIALNDSQSLIENKNESIDHLEAVSGFDSFIDMLSENKTTEDPSFVTVADSDKASPGTMQPSLSRNGISNNVMRNPYISASIKMKMNAIIADNKMTLTAFNRYQLYSSNKGVKRRDSMEATNYMKLSAHKAYPNKAFTFPGLMSSCIRTSTQRLNQIKQQIDSSIASMSYGNGNTCRSTVNAANGLMNTFRQAPSSIVSLKKRYINNNDLNSLKSLTLTPNQKAFTTLTPHACNLQLRKSPMQLLKQPKYTSRLFM